MARLAFVFLRHESLTRLGWNEARDAAFVSDSGIPGRVVRHDKGGYFVECVHGALLCELRGRLRKSLRSEERPGVGDWVRISVRLEERRGAIDDVLERSSVLLRKVAGLRTDGQVIAANVDTVLICVPSDADPNPRRLERELAIVRESGAGAVIVRTKSDLGSEDRSDWIPPIAGDSPSVDISMHVQNDVDKLAPWNRAGATIVVLGPSGAGKSTLANLLLGEDRLATGEVRADDLRGRHTTTWRELVSLPTGALLIDTPGIREVALWEADAGVSSVFDDVASITQECHFANCIHQTEPGCAVRQALDDATLDPQRWASYLKLQAELAAQARRTDARLASEEKRKWAKLSRQSRDRSDGKRSSI